MTGWPKVKLIAVVSGNYVPNLDIYTQIWPLAGGHHPISGNCRPGA